MQLIVLLLLLLFVFFKSLADINIMEHESLHSLSRFLSDTMVLSIHNRHTDFDCSIKTLNYVRYISLSSDVPSPKASFASVVLRT
jgi:hypothetical protein